MSDLSPGRSTAPPADEAAEPPAGLLALIRSSLNRLQDWWVLQSLSLKLAVAGVLLTIPATAFYAWSTLQQQALMASEVSAMAAGCSAGSAPRTTSRRPR